MTTENNTLKAGGEQAAVQYIRDQLDKSRSSLQRTRTIGIVLVVAVGTYMAYVTSGIRSQLQPRSAATIASARLYELVDEQSASLADQLKKGIPTFVGQLPDYALRAMPQYRADLEARVEADFRRYCQHTAQEMAKHLDAFLADNKDKIKEVLTTGQDLEMVRQLGPALELKILAYFKTKVDGEESIQDKFNEALGALDKVATTLNRLATAKDLTPQELKTRRAIAVMLKKADWKVAPTVE
jgi:hypothetical protein